YTGKLVVNALFEDLDPSDDQDDLNLEILDMDGNVLGMSTSTDSNEQVIIPVVAQETYFIRVFSDDDLTTPGLNEADDVNAYALEIENFPAPVPTGVHLDPASDTGMMNNDNVTSDTTPTVFIQTDVLEFVDDNASGMFEDPDGAAPDPDSIDALSA